MALGCLFLFLVQIGCKDEFTSWEGLTPDQLQYTTFDHEDFEQKAKPSGGWDGFYYYYKPDRTEVYLYSSSEIYVAEYQHPDSLVTRHYYYNKKDKKLRTVLTLYASLEEFLIGKEFHFDKKGKLIQVIDHDESFRFTLENVYGFVEQQGVDLSNRRTYDLFRSVDGYDMGNYTIEGVVWVVRTFEPVSMTYILDGNTGRILKETE